MDGNIERAAYVTLKVDGFPFDEMYEVDAFPEECLRVRLHTPRADCKIHSSRTGIPWKSMRVWGRWSRASALPFTAPNSIHKTKLSRVPSVAPLYSTSSRRRISASFVRNMSSRVRTHELDANGAVPALHLALQCPRSLQHVLFAPRDENP